MPAGPTYYKPLLDAAVLSAPLGDAIVNDVAAAQENFALIPQQGGSVAIAPTTASAKSLATGAAGVHVEGLVGGLAAYMAKRGAGTLSEVKLAQDDAGWVANRVQTTMHAHPELFDTLDPGEAAQRGKLWVMEAAKELDAGMHARMTGSVLDLDAKMAAVLKKGWAGTTPVAPQEAANFGLVVGRELERGVTPIPPDSDAGQLQWIEDATLEALAVWPGAAAGVAAAAGIKADAAAIEAAVEPVRSEVASAAPVKALHGLLGLAGIDPAKAQQHGDAVRLLQDVELPRVPQNLAAGILKHHNLAGDKLEWLTGRVLDVGGRPGNVAGLAAELKQLAR